MKGNYKDPHNIVGVVFNNEGLTNYNDITAQPGFQKYTYGITSVSPTGVESKDAKTVRVVN